MKSSAPSTFAEACQSTDRAAEAVKGAQAGRLGHSSTSDCSPAVHGAAAALRASMAGGEREYDSAKSVSLPPLRKSGDLYEMPISGSIGSSAGQAWSPMRRARKAELMAYALGRSPGATSSMPGMLLGLDPWQQQQQLASATNSRQDGSLQLEAWLDEALSSSQHPHQQQHAAGNQCDRVVRQQQQQARASGLRGAAAAGLARKQLLVAGLSNAAVDQLYRSLYVYSVGFFDSTKDVLQNNGNRQELLLSVWRAFLSLAEHALKSTFKSDYLSLVNAAGTAMAELLCSKQELAEARRDNASMVKDLGWLSASEAEASTLSRGLKAQVEELQAALALEQSAHQHAVKQYVDALDAKSAMQLQLQDAQQQLQELAGVHERLQQQHQELNDHYGTLLGQCKAVRDVFQHVDKALQLDTELVQQMNELEQQQQPPGQPLQQTAAENSNSCSRAGQNSEDSSSPLPAAAAIGAEVVVDHAEDLQPLAERLSQQMQVMHAQWRLALDARTAALTDNYRMGDELREAREATHQTGQQLAEVQRAQARVQGQLESSQASAADLERRLLAAHEAVAKHLLELGDAEGQLANTRTKAESLEQRCGQLEEQVEQLQLDVAEKQQANGKLEQRLAAAASNLQRKHRLMAEVSKGFAVAMLSLRAQQSARQLLLRLLAAERSKGIHLGSSLEGKDARLHDLDATVQEQSGRIARMTSELALLEASLADTQRQAMSLGSRLALAETKNDELLAQSQGQSEQLSDVTTRLHKALTKLELCQGQLEKKQREVKELQEAAKVSERLLGEARLLAKSLTADVERLTREKKDQADRAEAKQARLELEQQRLTGELAASDRKLELTSADLAAERDRVAGTLAVMERKRTKKRRWKAAYVAATSEVESLHKQLLAKQKELEGLEGRLKRLETELRLLGAGAGTGGGVRLPAAALLSKGGAAQPAVSVVDLPAARKAHESAASDVGRMGQDCLKLDEQIEEAEVEKQQLLLKLAAPDITSEQVAAVHGQTAVKVSQLQQLRHQREQAEAQRGEAAARLRTAEAAMRDAHQQRLQQRQWALEQQALQASELIHAAALGQLAAAEASEVALQAQLSQQLAAFEAAQADKAALAQRMTALQSGIDKFTSRISELQADKALGEEKLQRANTVISFLQVEVSNLKSERERIKLNASGSEERIAGLEAELEAAKQAVSTALKGIEAKHQADKQLAEQRQLAERARAAQAAKAAEAAAEVGPWAAARQAMQDVVAEANRQAAAGTANSGPQRLAATVLSLPVGLAGLSFTPDSLAVMVDAGIGSSGAADTSGDAGGGGAASKGAALVSAWWSSRSRPDLEGCVYDFFMARLGGQLAAEAHCTALVVSLRKAAPRSKRARLFGRCLGLLEPVVPPAGVGALLHFMAHLHCSCGPLTGEATEGSSQVMACTALQLAAEVLQPTLAPACPELAALPDALVSAAGGSSDNTLEVDDALELLLAAWLAQRTADQQQLEVLVRMVDSKGRGMALQDDFAALLKQVCPGAAVAMSSQQHMALFSAALRASGPGEASASAAGCAAALLDAGLVGCGAHLRRQPAITHRPPFSEYRLLEESWRAVKPALQELLRTLPKRLPAVAPEVSALQGLVKRLDDSLEGCAAAGEVWQLYRRILGFYSHHGKFQPVAPLAPAVGTGLSALLLSGAGGSSAQPSPASDGCAPAGSETVTSVTRLEDGVATNIDCQAPLCSPP
ncbi:hypothetical protein OEZ86_010576 [Tetradesmus obliquus]|nr:hypothetical protein OEZ86_010576 [Tetradesmus obliquus]